MDQSAHSHSPLPLSAPHPETWTLFLAEQPPKRLIVFIHGFRGGAVKTWRRFPESSRVNGWWCESDMLFVGYDSVRDTIAGAAYRLRKHLPQLYPLLPQDLLVQGDVRVRPHGEAYQELILVGHSLGGVVLRCALIDIAQGWAEARERDASATKPPILDAELRLFSPASAGFRSAGWLGVAQATPAWLAANLVLRRSSAYTDLQPGSEFLADTRRRTERLAHGHEDLDSLRARIVWANPEDVVLANRYDTDYVASSIDGTNHRSVCKPSDGYTAPWMFVETGTLE